MYAVAAWTLIGRIAAASPQAGQNDNLNSITAVVLGGTSLLGGRGTFLGPMLGAVLLQQALNATVFLDLGTVYQYYFQGLLILAAAILYTVGKVRRRQRAVDVAVDV